MRFFSVGTLISILVTEILLFACQRITILSNIATSLVVVMAEYSRQDIICPVIHVAKYSYNNYTVLVACLSCTLTDFTRECCVL